MLRQQSRTRQAEGRQQDSGAPGPDSRKPSNPDTQLRGFDGAAAERRQPTRCRNNDYALARFLELV
jgi:hypothetical protein